MALRTTHLHRGSHSFVFGKTSADPSRTVTDEAGDDGWQLASTCTARRGPDHQPRRGGPPRARGRIVGPAGPAGACRGDRRPRPAAVARVAALTQRSTTVRPDAHRAGQADVTPRPGRADVVTEQPSDATSVVLWCAHTGGRALDRAVCAPPCNAVHLRCAACGAAAGHCPFERPGHHERVVRQVLALVGDETETLLVVAIVERAGRSDRPVTWDAARSLVGGREGRSGRHRRTASSA